MTKGQFMKKSLIALQDLTGIDNAQWCRYLKRGQEMSVRTLKKAASGLQMKEQDLLDAIEARRSASKDGRYDVRRLSA
jgi:hypothetical protein